MNSQQSRQPLLIGQSDFQEFRKAGAYYVDKSLLIRELLECSFQVVLLPRPRRFGKTLNLSMLRYFFEKSEELHEMLFDGLAIQVYREFDQYHGKYPVIYLTLKDVKSPQWEECLSKLKHIVYKEFLRHRYLLNSDVLFPEEKEHVQEILEGGGTKTDYEQALENLSSYLYRHHEKRVVILIDEYDTPIQSGYVNGYYDEVISFMRNFLSGGLKDNPCLFKGVLTGILRVAKESIFSGLNNLGVYTLLVPEFQTAFGFTDEEVKALLAYYDLSARYDEVAYWYNGYLFGETVIYNPWSVLSYVASKNHQPKGYWVNTGGTEILEQLVTRGGRELREELGQLIEGDTITQSIFDNIVLRDIETRENLVWSFLLFSGYLKPVNGVIRKNQYELAIPNEEVKRLYEDLIERWFEEGVDLRRLEDMLNALQQGDMKVFERLLRHIVLEVMSYHDLAGEPEKVYQALVLGMLVWLSGSYEIRTNRESGYGRYDILLKPKNPEKLGIVLEFKQVYEDEIPETVLEEALQQIRDKRYVTELEATGVKDILQLAVAFRGKELWLKEGH